MKNSLVKKVASVVASVVTSVEKFVGKAKFVLIALGALVCASVARATGSSFPDITAVAGDAVTLIASLIAIGVTILAWKLGSRWIKGIVKAVAFVSLFSLMASHAMATGSSFPDITTVAGDATTLIGALIAIGVTILAWKLGSRWIKGIVK